jgi:hypothetical protein
MTTAAREVLRDCRVALDLLETEEDLRVWRIHWVASLALIRAVGHVLHKVDSSKQKWKGSIKSAYCKWTSEDPEHEIFREFINKERNNILKEYQFNFHPNDEVEVLVTLTGVNPITGATAEIPQLFPIGNNIYRPILDGYREGDDARDVYTEAIDWWEVELSGLEKYCKE